MSNDVSETSVSYPEINALDLNYLKEQNISLNKLEDLSFRFVEGSSKSFAIEVAMNGVFDFLVQPRFQV